MAKTCRSVCGVTCLRSLTPARFDVVAEGLAELGGVESAALDADEDGLLGEREARRVVLDEERRERGMDRDRPLAAALRLPDPYKPA